MFVTGEWRESFDKIYGALAPKPNVNEVLKQGRLRGAAGRPKIVSTKPNEGTLKASRELTLFLKEFIENNFGKGSNHDFIINENRFIGCLASLRRVVRENTYIERLLGIPPVLMSIDQPSVMISDRGMKYIRAMLLGQEIDLLIFNILVYSIVDIWFESTGTSILITYLLDSAVNAIRGLIGKVFRQMR